MPREKIIDGDMHHGSGVEGRRAKNPPEAGGNQYETAEETAGPENPQEPSKKRPRQGKPLFKGDTGADIFYSAQK
jgi:hypothetical protein